VIHDEHDMARCAGVHDGEYLSAERLAADPLFPSAGLLCELREIYGPDPTARLWIRALGLYRRWYCPEVEAAA
jgi:hypothetical protein